MGLKGSERRIVMSGEDTTELLKKMRVELSDLAQYVDNARQGIDEVEATAKLSSEKVPEASGQLNTLSGDLQDAANSIMTLLEELIEDEEKAGGFLEDLKGCLNGLDKKAATNADAAIDGLEVIHGNMKTKTMDLFANTSFADISGQKLNKVVNTITMVEKKIIELACGFGFEGVTDVSEIKKAIKETGDDTVAFDQNEVDRILMELSGGG
jgi:chemotaxis regulatin CheY-phosphate phosphatase CheZ